jgi:flagellin-specific chaperone FliS
LTVYQCDVRPISLVYNQLNQQNADNMISQLATVSGFYKMLEFCWSKVEFRGTQI